MPQEVPTAFFSYCREDSEFALKLAEDLKLAGAHVWIDQLDIEPGTPWDRAVEDALMNSPRMLVVLSPVSVNSDNVRDEVSFALSRQKRVIPVLYRDCNVPFRLARLQHIDFRPDYSRALTILLRALGVGHGAQAQAAGASAVVSVEAVVSTVEAEEPSPQQKLEEARKHAAEQAEIEEARRLAAEQARLKRQERERKAAEETARQQKLEEERRLAAEQAEQEEARKAAAEQADREEQERERQAAEEHARLEMSRREQRAAEQARLEEEARRAAERVRLAQEEQERKAAEIRARQEQLRREQQESVERAKLDLELEPQPPERVSVEEVVLEVEQIEPAWRPVPQQAPKSATKAGAAPSPKPQPAGRNIGSPKYLVGGAVAILALALIAFLLAHRGGQEKVSENKPGENKAAQVAPAQQSRPQPPAEQTPTPSTSPASQSAAAPESASTPDQTKEKTKAGADKKELSNNKNLAHPTAELSSLNPAADSATGTKLNAANAAPVRVSQGVSKGLLIHEVKPAYPPLARQARVQGPVVLHVVIAKNGAVKTISAETGHPMLIPAAIDAVKQWRYKPYRLDGKPVEVDTQVVVNFTLTN